jgi:hypothetical protein
MKTLLVAAAIVAFLAVPARAEPPDEIAGAWCLEGKSKNGDGIEALFIRRDCTHTSKRSLQIEGDGYRTAHDTCTVEKVTVWLGAGPRDEPSGYHTRYSTIASCKTKTKACTVKVSFYVRNDAKLGMWFLPADVRCEKRGEGD